MDLPYCKICGERHRLGHCPLYDEPPPIREKPRAEKIQRDTREPAQESRGAAAQDEGREIFQCEARPYTPEDMKQETMPDPKPRFDRTSYQRELMRKRRQDGAA